MSSVRFAGRVLGLILRPRIGALGQGQDGGVGIEEEWLGGVVVLQELDGRPIAESASVLIQAMSHDKPFKGDTEPTTFLGNPAQLILNVGTVPFNVRNITAETVSGMVGKSQRSQFDGFSPDGDLVWSLPFGEFPPGLSLARDGRLSGVATHSGVYRFTVSAPDGIATRSADIDLQVIFTGIALTPGEWVGHPDLGWVYVYDERIGYVQNPGLVFTGIGPWIYHFRLGWP